MMKEKRLAHTRMMEEPFGWQGARCPGDERWWRSLWQRTSQSETWPSALRCLPSAVTLALNGKAGVSEETRQRIQQIAQEMGYAKRRERPPLERRNIHYVVARKFFREEEAHVPHFHNLLMQSLEKHCRENNCFMVLHYVGSNETDHDRVMELIAGERDPMVVLQAADMPDDLLRRWQEAVPRWWRSTSILSPWTSTWWPSTTRGASPKSPSTSFAKDIPRSAVFAA